MKLREVLKHHWVGLGDPDNPNTNACYVARGHAGGVVMTGPMYIGEATEAIIAMQADGHEAVLARQTEVRAPWFIALLQLIMSRQC